MEGILKIGEVAKRARTSTTALRSYDAVVKSKNETTAREVTSVADVKAAEPAGAIAVERSAVGSTCRS